MKVCVIFEHPSYEYSELHELLKHDYYYLIRYISLPTVCYFDFLPCKYVLQFITVNDEVF